MTRAYKLWEVQWKAKLESNPLHLWIVASSAEISAEKAQRYLKHQGNTRIQIKAVIQHGTIDVF